MTPAYLPAVYQADSQADYHALARKIRICDLDGNDVITLNKNFSGLGDDENITRLQELVGLVFVMYENPACWQAIVACPRKLEHVARQASAVWGRQLQICERILKLMSDAV
jgi:hypothetical protein